MSAAPHATVVLASASVRRRELLEAAGYPPAVIVPHIDDGPLRVRPDRAGEDCCALAWFKVAQVLRRRRVLAATAPNARIVLAADTVCVLGAQVLGKPATPDAARSMLMAESGSMQTVVTGVAIHCLATGRRFLSSDQARVSFGALSPEMVDAHIASGAWSGRAGGYHIDEVLHLGWPLACEGDPSTVSGLPLRMVLPILRRLLGAGSVPQA